MKPLFFLLAMVAFISSLSAQSISSKISGAFLRFQKDSQLSNAIASLYVIDGSTDKVVFSKNSLVGLAPASTQKIITAATAFELLGGGFIYKTQFGYHGFIKDQRLNGSIYILPSGDPTLGSWRWKHTIEDSVMNRVVQALGQTGIKTYASIVTNLQGWEGEPIPGGWIWDDIGNYYGAGAEALNWRENQYDLVLKSGPQINDHVVIAATKPVLYNYDFVSNVNAAAKGSGDQSYIYFPVASATGVVRGTIPVGEEGFVISGAMPSARGQFLATLNDSLMHRGVVKEFMNVVIDKYSKIKMPADSITLFHTETSPPLDSICYWFLKRSINLYGEALVKTIAWKKGLPATTENGVAAVKKYWSEKNIGLDGTELNVVDGSGLSPLNRTTTHAQARILLYAKKQPWFAAYSNAFPEYNGMKLKSGTIQGVKSFCGYHTAKNGRQYIVSFIVNNYNGSAAVLVQKMFQVLDVLK